MFTTRHGTHLEPRFINKRLCQILEGARLLEPETPGVTQSTDLTLHGLGHTFSTLLLASTTPIKGRRRSRAGRAGRDGELGAQRQVLEDQVAAATKGRPK